MKFKSVTQNSSLAGTWILPVHEGEKPQHEIASSLPSSVFSGKINTTYPIFHEKENSVLLLVGLGKNTDYQDIKNSYRKIGHQYRELLQQEVTFLFPDFVDKIFFEAAISGFIIGSYDLGVFKSEPKPLVQWEDKTLFIQTQLAEWEEILERSKIISHTQLEIMSMVDLPPNVVTPEYLAQWCTKAGAEFGFSVKVLGKELAKQENLHAFLAVHQGSKKEPQFIIAQYQGNVSGPHLGLVGKGVTFDTGGLNLKTSSMEEMKSDMAGAAAVLGAIRLIAALKLPIQITAIVPCVENSIGSSSFLPSEVIKSYSGKSIEIIDTDAEGRLILADALSYLTKNFETDYLIDLATLTGSCIGTFGYECAALFSTNEELTTFIQKAANYTGEKVWPLPLWKVYAKEIESEVADVKNYHGKPFAGAIVAAKFLEYFTNNHPKWAHLDIAGTSFTSSDYYGVKHATAFGAHLLLAFAESLITNHHK
jgi:leucyl aminopeptidase